jgi:hypothetical protein
MTMDRHKKLDRWSGHAVPIASGQTRGDQVGPGQEQETDEFIYTIVSKQEPPETGATQISKETLRSGAPNLAALLVQVEKSDPCSVPVPAVTLHILLNHSAQVLLLPSDGIYSIPFIS